MDERLRSTDGSTDREQPPQAQRLRKDGQPDQRSTRFKREDERVAQTRALADRAMTERRDELTDDDRLMLLASSALDTILPVLPEIPGYSTIWLSATNPSDPIQRRIALGYEPVKPEDVPGFENLCVKAGEHVGFIACREMLAFKIRNELRLRYLEHMHHTRPAEEADRLVGQVTEMKDGRGRPIGMVEGEGLQREAPVRPDFSHLF